ncbi:hypothetical protein KM043_015499 [Ampulex compressa]|nr:hypothetical protein KM043_015499 [Ampulex compressa]
MRAQSAQAPVRRRIFTRTTGDTSGTGRQEERGESAVSFLAGEKKKSQRLCIEEAGHRSCFMERLCRAEGAPRKLAAFPVLRRDGGYGGIERWVATTTDAPDRRMDEIIWGSDVLTDICVTPEDKLEHDDLPGVGVAPKEPDLFVDEAKRHPSKTSKLKSVIYHIYRCCWLDGE